MQRRQDRSREHSLAHCEKPSSNLQVKASLSSLILKDFEFPAGHTRTSHTKGVVCADLWTFFLPFQLLVPNHPLIDPYEAASVHDILYHMFVGKSGSEPPGLWSALLHSEDR